MKEEEKNKSPQIKVSEDSMSVGDWIGIIILWALCFGVLIGFLWGVYCIGSTIDTNLTIPTREGWNYLGEGEAHPRIIVSSTDCYGNPTEEIFQNRIGDMEVRAEFVYTPVSIWCGFHVLPFSSYQNLPFYSYQNPRLNRNAMYELYEKKYWFSSNYLVICK